MWPPVLAPWSLQKESRVFFFFLRICFLIFVSYCFRNDHEVSSSPTGYADRYGLRVLLC